MKYDFNHRKIATQLLPTALRKSNSIAFLSALLSPLQDIYNDFITNKNRLSKEARYNSQTMLFEYLLNSEFDETSRRITIKTTSAGGVRVDAVLKSEGSKVLAYQKNEGTGKILANLKSEETSTDFIVYIPTNLSNKKDAIKRLINKYRFGGKIFEIIEL